MSTWKSRPAKLSIVENKIFATFTRHEGAPTNTFLTLACHASAARSKTFARVEGGDGRATSQIIYASSVDAALGSHHSSQHGSMWGFWTRASELHEPELALLQVISTFGNHLGIFWHGERTPSGRLHDVLHELELPVTFWFSFDFSVQPAANSQTYFVKSDWLPSSDDAP